VQFRDVNVQNQSKLTWPAEYVVARAYVDQLARIGAISKEEASQIAATMNTAEAHAGAESEAAGRSLIETAKAFEVEALSSLSRGASTNSDRIRVLLAQTIRELAGSM